MARSTFGGTTADFVARVGPTGALYAVPATLTFWTAETGGARVMDLLVDGVAASTVTVPAGGQVPDFQGPDGVGELWAEAGGGRVRMVAEGRRGLPGLNAVPTVDAVAEYVSDPVPNVLQVALNTTIGDATQGSGNIQATARKIADEYEDVDLVALGDSTTVLFLAELAPRLAALAPHRTVRQRTWSDATKTWGSYTTIATGSGSTFINIHNGGVGGTVWSYAFAHPGQWRGIDADCVILNYGINQGNTATAQSRLDYRMNAQRLALVVKAGLPDADLLLMSQNPRIDSGYEVDLATVRAQAVRSVAAEVGAAYAPVTEAYQDAPSMTALLPGGIHPNGAGATLTATTVLSSFKVNPNLQPTTRIPSSLLQPGARLLDNPDFGIWADPPTGWTKTGAACARDFTIYESAKLTNLWSLRITQTGAAQSRIEQFLPATYLQGQTITVAARLYLAAGQGSTIGRVELYDGTTVYTSPGVDPVVRDVWFWEYLTIKVPANCTSLRLRIIAGYLSTDTAADLRVSRVTVALGNLPRDNGQEVGGMFAATTPQRIGTETPGTAGVAARVDHVHSRIMSNPLIFPTLAADPASPTEGEFWRTAAGLFVWHGGAKKTVTLT